MYRDSNSCSVTSGRTNGGEVRLPLSSRRASIRPLPEDALFYLFATLAEFERDPVRERTLPAPAPVQVQSGKRVRSIPLAYALQQDLYRVSGVFAVVGVAAAGHRVGGNRAEQQLGGVVRV